jgi:ribonuclease D
LIGIDFETTALTPEEGRVRLVQIRDGGMTYVVDCYAASPRPLLETLEGETLVAHNANFEELWLWHEFCMDLPIVHDTMIMSQVLYGGTEDFKKVRHGLADVVQRELGIDLDKELQESDWGAEELTYEQLDYAAKDAEILLPLAGRPYSASTTRASCPRTSSKNASAQRSTPWSATGSPYIGTGWRP